MFTTFMLGATFLFVQINEYVHIGFSPQDTAQGSIFYGLTGLHGAHVAIGLTLLAFVNIRGVPRALQRDGAPRRRGAGHLLALRRRHVDRRLHDRLHHLTRAAGRRRAEPAALGGRGLPLPDLRDRRGRGGRRARAALARASRSARARRSGARRAAFCHPRRLARRARHTEA